MIGLVAGLPLSVPAPTRTARKPDPVEALYRALELRDNQISDVLVENRAVLRHPGITQEVPPNENQGGPKPLT